MWGTPTQISRHACKVGEGVTKILLLITDGIVTVWDTPTQISRHACKVGEGVTKLVLHPDGDLIYASTLDGDIKCLDLRTGQAVRELTGT